MGERKVVNKYYPPDFDPSKIPRRRQALNKQIKVRMMLPMSIHCNTCGNYIYKGTKFNSRKEDVAGETYLGIQVFRFYFKCTRCSAEITYVTDPKNSDYVVEYGATRNFEPWRGEDEEKGKREAEEMGDAMKSLENRTVDSKREMDLIAALDELKSMKSRRQAKVDNIDAMLQVILQPEKKRKLNDDIGDEDLIRSVFRRTKETTYIRRIDDEEEEEEDLETLSGKMPIFKKPKLDKSASAAANVTLKTKGIIIVSFQKKKSETNSARNYEPKTKKAGDNGNGSLKYLCQYDDSEE